MGNTLCPSLMGLSIPPLLPWDSARGLLGVPSLGRKAMLAPMTPLLLPQDKNRKLRPLYDIPYMFEAREFLRKKLIGKKVSCPWLWRGRGCGDPAWRPPSCPRLLWDVQMS